MILKKTQLFFFFFIIISLFLKVDFRLQDDIYCCSDDSDYYMHTETIVEDFDFDYINQLGLYKESRYTKNSFAPIGFPGSGIYASPFMLFGITLDYLADFFNMELKITSFKIFFYSMSSVFYLFFSIFLLIKTLEVLNLDYKPVHVMLLLLGTGISFYAFERYSMVHVYEVFSISILIYLSTLYYSFETNSNFKSFLIAFFMVLGFYVKWVHFYIFFIPFIIKKLFFPNKSKRLYFTFQFSSFFLLMIFIALTFSEQIYGQFTLNAANIYGKNLATEALASTANDAFYFLELLKNFLILLFTQEFGILWFQPILFTSTILIIYIFFKKLFSNSVELIDFILLITFAQVYIIQVMWESTGSSYGFRYLLNLAPISIIIFYAFRGKISKNLFLNILVALSIFSFISTIFFETTPETQLSLERSLNSFGKMSFYSQKDYLSGYIMSFFKLDSYFKIFITSYLGIFFLKPLISLLSVEGMFELFTNLGLPINNPKFVILVENVDQISYFYFVICFFTILFLSKILMNSLNLESMRKN